MFHPQHYQSLCIHSHLFVTGLSLHCLFYVFSSFYTLQQNVLLCHSYCTFCFLSLCTHDLNDRHVHTGSISFRAHHVVIDSELWRLWVLPFDSSLSQVSSPQHWQSVFPILAAWWSATSIVRAISRSPGSLRSFSRNSRRRSVFEMHLQITWSRIKSSLLSPNSGVSSLIGSQNCP